MPKHFFDFLRQLFAPSPAALVRRAAAGALVENLIELPDLESKIVRLLSDKSRSVRERGKFLARRAGISVSS